jgi:diacylglycerol kinase family enzyme
VDIPVTHVPAGSGNAFAKTQMEIAGELCKDEESIYLVVKNRLKEFNIVRYEMENRGEPVYSFLAF